MLFETECDSHTAARWPGLEETDNCTQKSSHADIFPACEWLVAIGNGKALG